MDDLIGLDDTAGEPVAADFLVIGSGVAGLWTALRLSEHGTVALVTKDRLLESSTLYAQGGIAVALYPEDSPEQHRADTLAAGAGLCDEPAVEALTQEGPGIIRQLVGLGAQFDMAGDRFALTQEAAHHSRRILHADGDATGREVEQCLADRVRGIDRIRRFERVFVKHLLANRDRECVGALATDFVRHTDLVIRTRATVLATGGVGEVYGNTTNPPVTTGDGLALAYRVGAALRDIEFVQFHPTALALPATPRFLISEAARGEGAVLRNARGERFMAQYHPDAELAPRDVVTRAIVSEMEASGTPHVFIDFTGLDPDLVTRRFPTIASRCREFGVDLQHDLVPVAPAAHYLMGGIATDLHGRTVVPGLYACGECACCGIHGANRLASNSLLEGLVYGDRCADAMLAEPSRTQGGAGFVSSPLDPAGDRDLRVQVQKTMWRCVGIIRSAAPLEQARRELATLPPASRGARDQGDLEVGNMALVGSLMAAAAFARTESRGAHYREDYPERDDEQWRRHVVLQRGLGEGMRLSYLPVTPPPTGCAK